MRSMKYFDFNVHLPYLKSDDVNKVVAQDLNLRIEQLITALDVHSDFLKEVQGANYLLFNTELFKTDTSSFFQKVRGLQPASTFTALIDFRQKDINAYLEKVKAAGVNAIMFNSYLQQIATKDFNAVLNVCKWAEANGIIVCIDGSYGTTKMHVYDNLKLACFITENVTKTPIVIVHSGGYRVIEFFLFAEHHKNVWLDTSFSLPYYIGSSLEQDYAFVYKKMPNRVIYGSDYPYKSALEAIETHQKFFDKYGFSEIQQEQILHSNALELFNL